MGYGEEMERKWNGKFYGNSSGNKFDVKLGSWGIIYTGEHSPLEVSTKPLHLPLGSSDLHPEREARV